MTASTAYAAPVADWMFVLRDLLRVHERTDAPGLADLTEQDLRDLLAEAARFHEEVLLPLSLPGDREGARLEEGRVRTPSGFREAWDRYRGAGWHTLGVPAELGGGGLPPVLTVPMGEMRSATAHSFSMYGAFCAPAATMLAALGAPWMREHVVPRLVAGDWTATMAMTESQAGSDLRLLRTRALPQPDGTWRIHGEKVFISGGDHDLTGDEGNIVHIVLAKVSDGDGVAPAELGAVNVFLVPARRLDPATGEVGDANGVRPTAVEHKMGIEGSATCALSFDGAVGWRIADDTRSGVAGNMAPIFFLMNRARLGAALSGVAYAELAYQYASGYAHERLSGRASGGARRPDLPADPLVVHPDIRRLLLSARSFAEGGRALAGRVALWQGEETPEAAGLVQLLIPVMKAFFTDRGLQSVLDCQQVLGGHGYLRDHPLEQWVRNVRISQIYEGANGIQARDLVRHRLRSRGGRGADALFDRIDAFVAGAPEEVAHLAGPVARASARLRATVARLAVEPGRDCGVAYDVLTAFGILAVAWTWVECVVAAAGTGDDRLVATKTALAGIWVERELPLVAALCERVDQGDAALTGLPDDLV